MTIKNFSIEQGLDLDGLVLTNGNGELLVNGNAISVDAATIANAIAGTGLYYDPADQKLELAFTNYFRVGGNNEVNGQTSDGSIYLVSAWDALNSGFYNAVVSQARTLSVASNSYQTSSTGYGHGEATVRVTVAGGASSRISKLMFTKDSNDVISYSEYAIIDAGTPLNVEVSAETGIGGLVEIKVSNSGTETVYATIHDVTMGAVNLPAGAGGGGGGK